VWKREHRKEVLQDESEALTCNKMEIDGKERGLEPSGPRSANEVAWVVHGCVIVM